MGSGERRGSERRGRHERDEDRYSEREFRGRNEYRSPHRDDRYKRYSRRERDEDRYPEREKRDPRSRREPYRERDFDKRERGKDSERYRFSPYRESDRRERGRREDTRESRSRRDDRERENRPRVRDYSSPSPPTRVDDVRKETVDKKKHEKEIETEYPEGSTEAMMAAMGLPVAFDTTKEKKVDDNVDGISQKTPVFRYRQYMNRKGGFNRPLDKIK